MLRWTLRLAVVIAVVGYGAWEIHAFLTDSRRTARVERALGQAAGSGQTVQVPPSDFGVYAGTFVVYLPPAGQKQLPAELQEIVGPPLFRKVATGPECRESDQVVAFRGADRKLLYVHVFDGLKSGRLGVNEHGDRLLVHSGW